MNRPELIKFIKEKRPLITSVNSKKKKELQEIYNKILEEESSKIDESKTIKEEELSKIDESKTIEEELYKFDGSKTINLQECDFIRKNDFDEININLC
jgi:hypothetical protein